MGVVVHERRRFGRRDYRAAHRRRGDPLIWIALGVLLAGARFDELIEAAKDEERAWREQARVLFLTIVTAGLRRGEILGLRWGSVHVADPEGVEKTGRNPPAHEERPDTGRPFGSTERRRSRTYPAVGYTTSPVLKTGWATGPMPLRQKRNAGSVLFS